MEIKVGDYLFCPTQPGLGSNRAKRAKVVAVNEKEVVFEWQKDPPRLRAICRGGVEVMNAGRSIRETFFACIYLDESVGGSKSYMYRDRESAIQAMKRFALNSPTLTPAALVPVEIEYKLGEGLDDLKETVNGD